MEPGCCAAGRAAVLRRHPPPGRATSTSSPSTCPPSSSTRTCSTASTWPACRCGPPTAPRTTSLVVAGGHCTLQPRAHRRLPRRSWSSATARRSWARSPRSSQPWKAARGRRAVTPSDVLAAARPASPASTCPRSTRPSYDRPTASSSAPRRAPPGAPDARREAHRRRPRGVARTPSNQLVPLTEVVHDRLNVEVFRGCTRGCRFCQAGMITRPVRERPADQVRTMVRTACAAPASTRSGSPRCRTADFSGHRDGVVAGIVNGADAEAAAQTSRRRCPRLRVDAFTVGIATEFQKARRTGLTFAPEGGTWRMRQVINKLITEEDLYGTVEAAYSQGWRRVKLYFLIGLPTETDEDTLGIAELARNVAPRSASATRTRACTASRRRLRAQAVHAVPVVRPEHRGELHAQGGPAARRHPPRPRACSCKWHDPKATTVEGPCRRGDRRVAAVIEDVWRHGGTLPGVERAASPSTCWLDALEPPRPRPSTGSGLPPPHRGRGPARGTTSRPGSTRTSSGRTGDALAEVGLAGLPLDPLLRLRRLHRLRHRARRGLAPPRPPGAARAPAQGPSPSAVAGPPGRRLERRSPRRRGAAAGPVKVRPPLLQAGQGALHQPPRRRPRCSERALPAPQLPVACTAGLSPRPRRCTSAWPCPPATSPLAEYLDVDLTEGTAWMSPPVGPGSPRALRAALPATARPRSAPTGTPSLQHAVTSS